MGDWLPRNRQQVREYIKCLLQAIYKTKDGDKIAKIEQKLVLPYHPAVQELSDRIDVDPKFNMFFNQMFTQIPPELMDTMDIKNHRVMLRAMSQIITMPPLFTEHHVGCPINGILTYPMGTISGYACFLDDEVNKYIYKILSAWKRFLQSGDSCAHLNETSPNGWFSDEAMAKTPGLTEEMSFEDMYKCDSSQLYWGFTSWDDYFSRRLKDDTVRPVESPNDQDVICNACESAPYKLSTNVLAKDKFWLKSMNYSITFMLANDPYAEQFVGGTVYQGFLSNLSYHRWHSPVDGKIARCYNVPGGFYTESITLGFDDEGDNRSQGYLTEVQTRALIFIQADNDRIGLMCFIGVGMGDVSGNEITVYEGQRVKKGDDLGTFHIGACTHCLVFRPGVKLNFDFRGQTPSLDTENIPVKSHIATVVRN